MQIDVLVRRFPGNGLKPTCCGFVAACSRPGKPACRAAKSRHRTHLEIAEVTMVVVVVLVVVVMVRVVHRCVYIMAFSGHVSFGGRRLGVR
jgi:hypothetical protein